MKKNLTLAVLVLIIFISELAFSDDILKGFDAYKDKDYKRAFEICLLMATKAATLPMTVFTLDDNAFLTHALSAPLSTSPQVTTEPCSFSAAKAASVE